MAHFIQSLRDYIDAELQAADAGAAPTKSHDALHPRPAAAIATDGSRGSDPVPLLDAFNERVAAVHLLLAERRLRDARDAWRELDSFARSSGAEAAPDSRSHGSGSTSRDRPSLVSLVCPNCGRRVASMQLHLRSCERSSSGGPGSSSGGGGGQAPPPPTDSPPLAGATSSPTQEVVVALRERVVAEVRSAMRGSAADPNAVRLLWLLGASLGDPVATELFSGTVVAQFSEFCNELRQDMDAVRSLQRVGLEAAAAASAQRGGGMPGAPSSAGSSSHGSQPGRQGLHPYLTVHASALGRGCDLSSDGRRAPHAGGRDPSAPYNSQEGAPADASSQVHVDALAQLLGEASTWMISVMEAGEAPHGARSAVATALLHACSAAALQVLRAYADDTLLGATLLVAQATLDRADEAGGGNNNEDRGRTAAGGEGLQDDPTGWTMTLDLCPPPREAGGGGAKARASPLPAPREQASPQQNHHMRPFWAATPLTIHSEAAIAVIDETADQLSFLCQVLERFLRCASVCLSLGPGDQPSRMGAGALSDATHELQGQYVLLEHAYLVSSVSCALLPARGGWAPVAVHEDAAVLTFAWADNAFFVLGKALARAAATCCDMAAAATLNYVSRCLEGALAGAAHRAVGLARELRGSGAMLAQASRALGGGRPAGDALEEELSLRFSSALLGDGRGGVLSQRGGGVPGGAAAVRGGAPGKGGGQEEGDDEADNAQLSLLRTPLASDAALWALNTLVTVQRYAHALFLRAAAELGAVFPSSTLTTADDPSTRNTPCPSPGGAPSPQEEDAAAAEEVATGALALRVHASLQGPLLELHRVAFHCFRGLGEAAAVGMARSVCAEGLRALGVQLHHSVSYSLSEVEFDALAVHGPVASTVKGALVRGAAIPATLRRLLAPDCREALLRSLGQLVAEAVEHGWFGAPVNEWGALLMRSELSSLMELLGGLAPVGSAGGPGPRGGVLGLRAAFARLQQGVAVLSVESVSELYIQVWPEPALRKADVVMLLLQRVGPATVPPAAIDAIQWGRVRVVDPEAELPARSAALIDRG